MDLILWAPSYGETWNPAHSTFACESEDPEELEGIIEAAALSYYAFLIDVTGMPGQDARPLVAEEVSQIVKDNVGAPEWYLGY